MEFLELLIREVLPWQWAALVILVILGFIVLSQLKRPSSPSTKKKMRRAQTETIQFQFATAQQEPQAEEQPVLPISAPPAPVAQPDLDVPQGFDLDIDDEEDETDAKTTSVGAELSNKKFGLILLCACAILRYYLDVQFPELWLHSPWQLHGSMAVIVSAFWIYGMLRENKRSFVDVLVNILLGLWAFLLFLVEGGLS